MQLVVRWKVLVNNTKEITPYISAVLVLILSHFLSTFLISTNFKMQQFRFDYSLKNIPIPLQDAYLKNSIEKVESVIKHMRWNAHFFNKNSINKNNHFGLASNKTPPSIPEMKPFETDLIKTHRKYTMSIREKPFSEIFG